MSYQREILMEPERPIYAGTSRELVYDPEEVLTVAKNLAVELEPDFEYDQPFEETMWKLALYFANDPRFESEGHGKLRKGLFILGPTGSGKTLLMRSFKYSPFGQLKTVGTNKIVDAYLKGGIDMIEGFLTNDNSRIFGYCFDDLGSENPSVKYMGSECNCMTQIILNRYEERLPYYLTHFTSNIDGQGIETMYGPRVRSRIKEMVNVIKLLGEDRRTKK